MGKTIRSLGLILVTAAVAVSQCSTTTMLGPFLVSGNISWDAKGDPDTRPYTWGNQASVESPIVFTPPPGYRVRILHVHGDYLMWPRGKAPEGTFAGGLWALRTTAPDGSVRTTLPMAADNHLLYVQTAIRGAPSRVPVDMDTRAGNLLEADNTLISKMAVWLNDTGLVIHMEATFTIRFQFEATATETSIRKPRP